MKRIFFMSLLLISTSHASHASQERDKSFSYKVYGDGGVSKTTVRTWSIDDPRAPKPFWVTTAGAKAFNMDAPVNTNVKVTGYHEACWNNSLFFGVDARYKFTIHANNLSTESSDELTIPRRTIKCISQETYVITKYPIVGSFMYTVTTHAETEITNPIDSNGSAYVIVK